MNQYFAKTFMKVFRWSRNKKGREREREICFFIYKKWQEVIWETTFDSRSRKVVFVVVLRWVISLHINFITTCIMIFQDIKLVDT